VLTSGAQGVAEPPGGGDNDHHADEVRRSAKVARDTELDGQPGQCEYQRGQGVPAPHQGADRVGGNNDARADRQRRPVNHGEGDVGDDDAGQDVRGTTRRASSGNGSTARKTRAGTDAAPGAPTSTSGCSTPRTTTTATSTTRSITLVERGHRRTAVAVLTPAGYEPQRTIGSAHRRIAPVTPGVYSFERRYGCWAGDLAWMLPYGARPVVRWADSGRNAGGGRNKRLPRRDKGVRR
jgi:hypothetical protein